jgi:hypothetical protein
MSFDLPVVHRHCFFSYSLFNNSFSIKTTWHQIVEMNDELKRILEGSSHGMRYYPSICLERLMKTTKRCSQDSHCPNQESPEYKSRALPLNHRPGQCSFWGGGGLCQCFKSLWLHWDIFCCVLQVPNEVTHSSTWKMIMKKLLQIKWCLTETGWTWQFCCAWSYQIGSWKLPSTEISNPAINCVQLFQVTF